MKQIYLDYAAATPVDSAVLDAMLPYFSEEFHNPSAIHAGGRAAHQALESARASVSQALGVRPSEIIFTAGGTESINLAIDGVMNQSSNAEIIISGIEHDAVRKSAMKYNAFICPVDGKGVVKIKELEQLITENTQLISIIHASNEIGTVQPLKDIAEVIEKKRKERRANGNTRPLLLHTDASQSPNYLDVTPDRLGVDMMTLNGGKIYGPKQSGILYVKAGITLQPQVVGGGQEHGLRSGTENVAFAAGFAKALELAVEKRKDEVKRLTTLTRRFIQELEQRFSARLNGHPSQRLINNIHVSFPGCDNERVLFSLDDQGVMAAAGSACSASKEEVSPVLTAIGLTDKEAQSSIRFSLGRQTTEGELDETLKCLSVALKA